MSKSTKAPDPSTLGDPIEKPKVEVSEPSIILKKAKKENIMDNVEDIINPSLTVYGCGGMGTNIVSKFGKDFSTDTNIEIIDTSKSNLVKTGYTTKIISGNGSGKVRGANVDDINKYITAEMFQDKDPSDINVVIFSLSGGTGSVIGPLLIKELHRLNKAVIAIAVSETASQLDTENTSRTFMSLEAICKNDDIYLPMMVFDNAYTRSKVDTTIRHRLGLLTNFITTSIFELDKSDKINWLRPDKTIGSAPGVYGCYITHGKTNDYSEESGEVLDMPNDHLFDSIIFVANNSDQMPNMDSRILYKGLNEEGKTNMVGILGFPISDKFIETLNSRLSKYQSQMSTSKELGIKTKNQGSGHTSGLIV